MTKNVKKRRARSGPPTVFGTGLLALDLVLSEGEPAQIAAGGTCGNVLLALAYMGWRAIPVGRLANDSAGRLVETEFTAWGADTSFLHLAPTAPTPVIVERLSKDTDGHAYHSFSFSCPSCGERLPMYRPITLTAATNVSDAFSGGRVIFIDRVSPSSITLAEAANRAGLLVYFEPSSMSDLRQFRKLLALSHIVKYSQDRIEDLGDTKSPQHLLLEIQTLGRGGIRFKTKLGESNGRWHTLPAPKVERVVDTAGAGDWFSAGLLHSACRAGLEAFQSSSLIDLLSCLAVAQGLAAWNCEFLGARGGMYSCSQDAFSKVLKTLQTAAIKPGRPETSVERAISIRGENVCLRCDSGKSAAPSLRIAASVARRFM